MNWFQRLWQALGVTRTGPAESSVADLGAELRPLIETLADAEETTIEQMAYQLLYSAALQRHADLHNLRQWEQLTPREQQTAAFVCLGYTNREIAELMVISPNTVKTHIRNIYGKFNINSKAELQQALAGWDFRTWLVDQGLWPPNADLPEGITPRD